MHLSRPKPEAAACNQMVMVTVSKELYDKKLKEGCPRDAKVEQSFFQYIAAAAGGSSSSH
jgi:hypothetical protein